MRTPIVVAALLLTVGSARADRRAFTHTYEYVTQPEGALELEFYNTQSRPDFSSSANAYELQVEVEYGITNHWDVSLYQVFAQGAGEMDTFEYDKTKLRTRYRFAERGEWPIDVLLYFEVAKPLREDEVELEPKIILARDFGPVTVALNLIGELRIGDETKFIPGWALGIGWEVVPAFKIGVESFGEVEDSEVATWLGPALSWAPSPKLWITGTVAFGLTDVSDDLNIRLILGLGF